MKREAAASVEDVRSFWERQPLWSGESRFEPGSLEFFEEQRATIVQDGFVGRLDERVFPPAENGANVLDLGCGPGFWTVELASRGCRRVVAADLTERALDLTRRRVSLYGFHDRVELHRQNAESMTFQDGQFSHVNCQGVIHHTLDASACIREIARVLAPGGSAVVSVYYRNAALRAWPGLRPLGRVLAKAGVRLRGRGRERMLALADADEIVRTYDGDANPVGRCYSRREFEALVAPHFEILDSFLHFFPARAFPFRFPRLLHGWLSRNLGFLIVGVLRKRRPL